MARLIKHERKVPYEIAPSDQPSYVCACGLSKNKPFCDGTHKKITAEEPAEIYIYDEDDKARPISQRY